MADQPKMGFIANGVYGRYTRIPFGMRSTTRGVLQHPISACSHCQFFPCASPAIWCAFSAVSRSFIVPGNSALCLSADCESCWEMTSCATLYQGHTCCYCESSSYPVTATFADMMLLPSACDLGVSIYVDDYIIIAPNNANASLQFNWLCAACDPATAIRARHALCLPLFSIAVRCLSTSVSRLAAILNHLNGALYWGSISIQLPNERLWEGTSAKKRSKFSTSWPTIIPARFPYQKWKHWLVD